MRHLSLLATISSVRPEKCEEIEDAEKFNLVIDVVGEALGYVYPEDMELGFCRRSANMLYDLVQTWSDDFVANLLRRTNVWVGTGRAFDAKDPLNYDTRASFDTKCRFYNELVTERSVCALIDQGPKVERQLLEFCRMLKGHVEATCSGVDLSEDLTQF